MQYFVLVTWIIQASVGIWLLVGWARHSGRHARSVVSHAVLMFVTLALWIAFIVTGLVGYAWATLAVFFIGIPFGEVMMVRRSRRLRAATKDSAGDYGRAVVDVVRGRMPPKVTFHGLFSAVVFFSCLGVCIGATIAALA